MRTLLGKLLVVLGLTPFAGAQTVAPPEPATPVVDEQAVEAGRPETPALQTAASASSAEASPAPVAEPPAEAPQLRPRIRLREFLVLPPVAKYGRRPLHQNPIDAALALGAWQTPEPGDTVVSAAGDEVAWRIGIADAVGRLSGPAAGGGYALANVAVPEPRVMLLEATRHAAVCVNGIWLAGDRYGAGPPYLPIKLEEGANELLFQVALPGFQATLTTPPADVELLAADTTLPDLVAGETGKLWGALPVRNASEDRLAGGELRVTIGDATETTPLPPIEPLTLLKAPFQIPVPESSDASPTVRVALHLSPADGGSPAPDPVSVVELPLNRVAAGERHVKTFVSRIDGSVQAYSVLPASEPASRADTGVILALHGAGVDHAAHAKNFRPKAWAHVVVPQNRRPHGFDWEDWGAADAMEALAAARRRLPHDPRRTHVTGHGIGGYGAWRLATRYPDQFASLGPSAASVVRSVSGPSADEHANVRQLLERGPAARQPIAALRNLSTMGVYLLHGANDRRVQPAESRFMRRRLGDFHPDFVYYERPGAGHWWGRDGVDWPPMVEFFRTRRTPEPRDVRRVDFTTGSPAESSSCFWATVDLQEEPLQTSRVTIDHDPLRRSFTGRTENVAWLTLDLRHLTPGEITVRLDGEEETSIAWPDRKKALLLAKNEDGVWESVNRRARGGKTTARGGLLKSAFNNRALLVYGTGGSPDENRWAATRARLDAQEFWRRGNGSLEVVPDHAFDATAAPNRSVVLYGNAETNAAWPSLLSTSPVQIRSGEVKVSSDAGDRPERGDLAVLMVRPRPGSNRASVAVVGGTSLVGMRLTDRLRYFVSGVTYPDLLVFGPRTLTDGVADVRAAGFFGFDWKVGSGEVAWRDIAL